MHSRAVHMTGLRVATRVTRQCGRGGEREHRAGVGAGTVGSESRGWVQVWPWLWPLYLVNFLAV